MAGFFHEFKRNYNTVDSISLGTTALLGFVQDSLHVDPSTKNFSTDTIALGALDAAALHVPVPGKSDVRTPVDGVGPCFGAYRAGVDRSSGGQQALPGVDHGICAISG
jgi:hypothetical protein